MHQTAKKTQNCKRNSFLVFVSLDARANNTLICLRRISLWRKMLCVQVIFASSARCLLAFEFKTKEIATSNAESERKILLQYETEGGDIAIFFRYGDFLNDLSFDISFHVLWLMVHSEKKKIYHDK